MRKTGFLVLLIVFFASCETKKQSVEEKTEKIVTVPEFSGDSAYFFTEKQVKFGPRIPNSPEHKAAANYFIAKLKNYGATVVVQEFEAISFDGQNLFLKNIIASFQPEKQKRILIAAHWDTRPFSDKDKEKPNAKFDGANDGASGAAVLLELARVISKNSPEVGVDLIFFDGEDWGEGEKTATRQLPNGQESWWCLGSQYWSRHKHKPNYSAYYGILLDMVGAKGTHFFQESYSVTYAPKIVDKIWRTAGRLGHSSLFVQRKEGSVTDDHVFVNEWAKIPMADIIPYDPQTGAFGDYHHAQSDNMSVIDKTTLQAVGDVVLNVIFYEEP